MLGIDLSTQKARVVASDLRGTLVAETHRSLVIKRAGLPDGWVEQSPEEWWAALRTCLSEMAARLRSLGYHPTDILSISVASTSGTIFPVDQQGNALYPALMYNDSRAVSENARVQSAARELTAVLGYEFKPSFALPKLLWLFENRRHLFRTGVRIVHAGDYIIGKLTGDFTITDYTNALKTGYDLVKDVWPQFIARELGIPMEILPQVVPPGTVVGKVASFIAVETGLDTNTLVVAGMTDGCAAQVAAGAVELGSWNTTIGTTLVVKGVTERIIKDPSGAVYSHKHPLGYWMPGGASNTGGECLTIDFAGDNLDNLNRSVPAVSPTNLIVFPLKQKGERYPINSPQAEGFICGKVTSRLELYAAYLEGVAYVQRLAYEVLSNLGAEVRGEIRIAGGTTKSPEWVQLQADVLGARFLQPENPSSGMGAAILAAAPVAYGGDIISAARTMVRIERTFEPRLHLKPAYDDRYQRFKTELVSRGYM